ncbi:MAG: DUF475 domain-containing protein [Sulfurimonas sp.]|jgi:hypothetical protein|nr:DUF475 domain-containing protein [Sulfurimonas sp.]MBU1218055.1 DUF475 domain-containing protein [bacterium]MBU1434782.1 DUF475 domain-containing protein [bacterium]MBU1502770.1 DUF475 domain-containing protein [bacterium]MBU3940108.1 DUF475 domain-containing protein [bacterium]
MRYFYSSFIIMAIGLLLSFYLGGLAAIYITFLLIILEISLSFDNAVVNAKVLAKMDPIWQKRFILFGIPIAVFGMRLLFPLAIVAIVTGMGLLETLDVAMNDPATYESILKSTEGTIFAFGGAFLLMVFLDFFFEAREITWFGMVENSRMLKRFSGVSNIELIIAIIVGLSLGEITQNFSVVMAFMFGVLLHSLLGMVDHFLSSNTVKSGIAGFIYLEVLDASFSFDGVIGAFALTSNIFIIMIGLGVGAMFVRSLTIYFVEHKTLSEYQYLEHGAHYAIGILAIIMLMKITMHISEAVTGTVGIGLILVAFLHSVWENKKASKA